MDVSINTIRLFAFILAHKARKVNSCIYECDKSYLTAKEIGCSPNTYKKRIVKLRKLGLINGSGAFVSIEKCMRALFSNRYFINQKGKEVTPLHFVDFFGNIEKRANVSYYEDIIKLSFFKENCCKQEFHNKVYQVVNRTDEDRNIKGDLKRLKKLYKKYGFSSFEELKCASFKTEIFTGKSHLSNLLGCSPSTGARYLRRWAKEKAINRIINKLLVKCEPDEMYQVWDRLKSKGYKYIIPCNGGFSCTLGSIVSFN